MGSLMGFFSFLKKQRFSPEKDIHVLAKSIETFFMGHEKKVKVAEEVLFLLGKKPSAILNDKVEVIKEINARLDQSIRFMLKIEKRDQQLFDQQLVDFLQQGKRKIGVEAMQLTM